MNNPKDVCTTSLCYNVPMNISQEQAIQILQEFIDEVPSPRNGHGFSMQHTRWLANTLHATKEIFGANSLIHRSLASFTQKAGSVTVIQGFDVNKAIQRANQEAYLYELEAAVGLLKAGIDQIKQWGLDNV